MARQRQYRSFRRNAYAYVPYAVAAGKMIASKMGGKGKGSTSYSTTKKKNTSQSGVSYQKDMKVIYKKRFMPAGKKRVWRRFKNKVKAAIDVRGVSCRVYNDLSILTENTKDLVNGWRTQQLQMVHLYGGSGSFPNVGELGSADVSRIYSGDSDLSTTQKITMKSAVCDVTVTNLGTENYNGPLEIDVYEMIYRNSNNNETAIYNYFSAGSTSTVPIDATLPKIHFSQRGVTPFDHSVGLSESGIKIISKTKHFLAYNQSFTHQIRDPKNHVIQGDDIIDGIKTKQLRTLLFIAKPTAADDTMSYKWSVSCTRTYKYTKEGQRLIKNDYAS